MKTYRLIYFLDYLITMKTIVYWLQSYHYKPAFYNVLDRQVSKRS